MGERERNCMLRIIHDHSHFTLHEYDDDFSRCERRKKRVMTREYNFNIFLTSSKFTASSQ